MAKLAYTKLIEPYPGLPRIRRSDMNQIRSLLLGGRAAIVVAVICSPVAPRYAAHGSPTASCTMRIFAHSRDSITTYLLGRSTADTILAGTGLVFPQSDAGWARHPGVFGQLIQVETLAGAHAEDVRKALAARRSSEVVVVPWGYDPGCGTDYWRRSARWTTPDSMGVFSLRLRPESLWVSGYPTFDARYASVYTYAYGPYTLGPHDTVRNEGGTHLVSQSTMSAAEVFALYMALPIGTGDSTALARLREWVRANPTARTKYPGFMILPRWGIDSQR